MISMIDKICKEEVTVYGYANMKNMTPNPDINSQFNKYPHAISIGINIPDEIIDTIDIVEIEEKYLQTYIKINSKLNEIGTKIESILHEHKYMAKFIDASSIVSKDKLKGDISHKLVANLAGLGWIGKSCLLINPYYGPRIRWATIITDAPLPYAKKQVPSRCGTCRLCSVNCPSHAIKNIEFNEENSRETRYDAYACNDYFNKLEAQNRPRLCGLCIKVCPWGLVNKKSRKKRNLI